MDVDEVTDQFRPLAPMVVNWKGLRICEMYQIPVLARLLSDRTEML